MLVGGESYKGVRIGGPFRTGDNVAFARAVAALHRLVMHHTVRTAWSLRRIAEAEEIGE